MMTELDDVIAVLRASHAFHIATVDVDGHPRSRPFNAVLEYEGHLVFGTATPKKVYAELLNNPYVAISAFDAEKFTWIRIHGQVKWLEDIEVKKKVFEVQPHLRSVYQTAENPIMKMFYVEGRVDIYVGPGSMRGPTRSIEIT
jgi:uncharacterized pyridoxamine 5'-phosphate oxidase family protein